MKLCKFKEITLKFVAVRSSSVSPLVVFGSDGVSAFMSIGEENVCIALSSKLEVQMVVFAVKMADVVGELMLDVNVLFSAIVNLYQYKIWAYRNT